MLRSNTNRISLPEQDATIVVMSGKKCRTAASFYENINLLLALPDYFGANLDALYDCLCDLSWLPEHHVTIIFTQADQIFAAENAEQKAALLETLEQAEVNQYEADRSFRVILLGNETA